jgi:hypothetical protein
MELSKASHFGAFNLHFWQAHIHKEFKIRLEFAMELSKAPHISNFTCIFGRSCTHIHTEFKIRLEFTVELSKASHFGAFNLHFWQVMHTYTHGIQTLS